MCCRNNMGAEMKIAVLSDIHGNYEALQTCTQYALERGAKAFIFLGDYLGELAFPQRTMEFLYALKDAHPCVFIKGNKEDYWLNYKNDGEWKTQNSTTGCLYYVYHNLTERDIKFFSELEMTKVLRFSAMEPITLCHGSPRRINEGMYPGQKNTYEIMEGQYLIEIEHSIKTEHSMEIEHSMEAEHFMKQGIPWKEKNSMEAGGTRLILCGHTHVQRKIEYKGRCVLNPGSAGIPL